jgi:DNA-binding NarL/FixJ family response regulator
LGAGRSDPEIAEALFISPKTASVHVANIKAKLRLGSRLEVALRARELGLFGDTPTTLPASPQGESRQRSGNP